MKNKTSILDYTNDRSMSDRVTWSIKRVEAPKSFTETWVQSCQAYILQVLEDSSNISVMERSIIILYNTHNQ